MRDVAAAVGRAGLPDPLEEPWLASLANLWLYRSDAPAATPFSLFERNPKASKQGLLLYWQIGMALAKSHPIGGPWINQRAIGFTAWGLAFPKALGSTNRAHLGLTG